LRAVVKDFKARREGRTPGQFAERLAGARGESAAVDEQAAPAVTIVAVAADEKSQGLGRILIWR
jgi:hypothetical protein